MTDDLFGNPEDGDQKTQQTNSGEPSPETGEPEPKPPEPTDINALFADQLSEIKSPDGRQKYADVQTALSSIPHAQALIEQQKDEIEHLKEQQAQNEGVQEMLKQIKEQQDSGSTPTPEIDVASINEIVERTITDRETLAIATKNKNSVVQKLKELYGDEAEQEFKKKADELGLGVSGLTSLALKSPKAALAYFQKEESQPDGNPAPSSTVTPNKEPKKEEVPDIFGSGADPLISKWRQAAPSN